MQIFLSLLALALQQPAPQVALEPFSVNVAVDLGPGHTIRTCRVETSGHVAPHWLDNACTNISSAPFLRALGLTAAAQGRLDVVLAMEANGRPGARPATAPVIFRAEAVFEVASDGTIARCTRGETAGNGTQLDLCAAAFPERPDPFVASAEPRSGRLSLTAYHQ